MLNQRLIARKKKNKPAPFAIRVIWAICIVILLVHFVHAITLDRMIEYKEVSFSSPNVPEALDGYRIAFIADTHSIPEKRLRAVATELDKNEVDLVVLGGDFSNNDKALRQSLDIISQIAAKDGIYGVDGNNDNFAKLTAAMKEYSIVPLSNSGLYIHEGFFLAGVEDLRKRRPNIPGAIAGSSPDDFVLLVAHNPDITMKQDTSAVDLVLSGHTHGGQITFFGLWAPLLATNHIITDYGQRFMSGWALSEDGAPVFVSNGTGEYLPRVFARPQVILVTLAKREFDAIPLYGEDGNGPKYDTLDIAE